MKASDECEKPSNISPSVDLCSKSLLLREAYLYICAWQLCTHMYCPDIAVEKLQICQ